jgi:hypothetical protein
VTEKIKKSFQTCVCVCVYARACACACVCVSMCITYSLAWNARKLLKLRPYKLIPCGIYLWGTLRDKVYKLKLVWSCPVVVHIDFRIILFCHIHTTTAFWYYYIFLVYHSFLTLLVQHVSGYCNPSSGTYIKQFARLRMASQYVLHWMCSNCKIHLL